MKHQVEGVLWWLGETMEPASVEKLDLFGSWLADEAVAAGGIGPQEGDRIRSRHIAESLAFGCGLDRDATSVLDVGTGVGLPGIPLAILRPTTQFILLDRSGRRSDLAARAVRVLDLPNATVVRADVSDWVEECDGVAMRATMSPAAALPHVRRLLRAGRHGVIALSRRDTTPSIDSITGRARRLGLEVAVISARVLDSPTSLLRITRDDDSS